MSKRNLTISIQEELYDKLQLEKSMGTSISDQIESYCKTGKLPTQGKSKRFNMAECTGIANKSRASLKDNTGKFSVSSIIKLLNENNYLVNNAQAELVKEMMIEYEAGGI